MESGSPKPEEITKQEAYESLSADVENDEKKVSSEQSSSGTSKDKKQEISGPEKHYRSIAAMFKYVTHRKAIYASLLNDYVESDVFVIDGDSLLISCACDASLKKGQSLHFFFLVERFLLNLTDKGARYVIVFFEDMEQTYSQRSVLKCWRTQLKIHLLKNTKTTIITFPNFFSAQWKTFLKEQAPYFIMVSDRGVTLEQTYFLNMLMLHSLENKLDVVLTAGQESDNLRVYGFHIKSSLPTKMLITQLKKSSKEPLKTIQLQKHELIKSPLEALKTININEQVEKCISLFQTHQKDVRAVTCVLACSLALRVSAESKQDEHMSLEEASDLCKMHCLCVAIMVIVPLSQRTRIRKLTTQWNKKAVSFLNTYTLCAEIALTQMKDHIKDKLIDWTYVSDIKDDLLLKNIVNYYEKENNKEFKLEFGNEINQLYTFLWETALKLIPKNEHWLSCELRKSSTPFLSEDSTVHVEKEEVDPVGLIPMQSDIIEDFAGDMIKELPIMCSDDPRIPLLMNTKTYDELSHWHTNRPLSDDYDRTKNNSNEKKYDRERGLRDYQKLQLFQYRYGQSLGVKTSKKIVLKNDQPEEKSSAYVAFKKKEPQKKKKDQIIEENLKKTRAEEEKKEMGKWKTMATSLEKDVMVDFFSGLQKLEIFIRSFQTPYVKYQAQLRALSICFDKWSEECKMKCKYFYCRNKN
ncbi:hypothetical protein GDO81_000560 [Engystomops pustulosus]|uniref:ATP-dependent RNA helicase DDX60 PIN-like domain-containing protein n=1 Tax=Engystomops pustulosus TaxID=76066 RepID=A0AAV7D608_ENGPU|nr:hypothetical protein GDO81_000560 [Engystomops pustulosus]KAG8592609.1 hypothetical protein GDO81_000560 [Engystomops pustulosus]